ncbi:MAG: hypothetical protein JW981_06930 [Anaerolineae bacterium]|nr:hypothetical protein [Anaerolineae bacterium]
MGKKFKTVTAGLFAAIVVVVVVYVRVLLPWHMHWGATDEEVNDSMPGDEIVPNPSTESTRAITIHARVSEVWPWLVQLGQGRGGMYSYEFLENLVGCDIHNADHVLPDYQTLEPGDIIRMGPEGYPFYIVQAVESEKSLVLQAGDPVTQEPGTGSWAFQLIPQDDGTSRLITRQRAFHEATFSNFLIWNVFTDPISFVMEQKMLRTIRDRAEGKTPSLF